ncbi:hypothetical protein QFC19_006331 [Naganishia cerealis]|uniref:Uncharacterized protein n=1 Tax=Naganishia cerealis TaxID=610337 RepID=A0ACC2VH32_9TREE|nr:hypothetical protein QFC19_006331 [Naganishia cerealis]
MEQRSKPYKPIDVAPESALMTIVKPRNELPHAKTITEEHPNVDIDPDVTLVVLHDSLEIPPMALTKPRRNVGPQGHNGLRSIEAALGTRDFWRIGLGIGRPSGGKGRGDGVRDWGGSTEVEVDKVYLKDFEVHSFGTQDSDLSREMFIMACQA